MKCLVCALPFLFAASASAAVINFEFRFTPFVGDPASADQVRTVAGTARLFVNNVPIAEQAVQAEDVPVMFEEREIAPSVWVPVASAGTSVRRGANTFRVEFEPEDAALAYRAQLRWAAVNDETYEDGDAGAGTATNQSVEGVVEQAGKGALVMERAFDADFGADLPWHHYPPVSALSDDDRAALHRLLVERAALFAPDFAGVYAILAGKPQVDIGQLKSLGCLEAVYTAGLRMAVPAADALAITLTGNPEVVLARRDGEQLFQPADPAVLARVTDEDVQMCSGMALMAVYPPKLVVVRNPGGSWEIVN